MKRNQIIAIAIIGTILFIAILISRPFYQVAQYEEAVITRFGKYVRTTKEGLHGKWPFGIEKAIKKPVKKVLKQEFGFVTVKSGVKSEFYRGDDQIREARMLSADLKIIQVEWIVQYKISDPKAYIFNVRNQVQTLRDYSIIAMSQVAGDYLFDEIITIAKSEITFKMQEHLQKMLDEIDIGITVTTVQLLNVTPPSDVEEAYNEVLQAQQERDKIINEAKKLYNEKVIPVEGEKERMIQEAEGYKYERVEIAKGEAQYFNDLYLQYAKAPDITKKRIYLETMNDVLKNLDNVYIVDEDQKNMIPLLQMGNTTTFKEAQ